MDSPDFQCWPKLEPALCRKSGSLYMKRMILFLLAPATACAQEPQVEATPQPLWSLSQVVQLKAWVTAAPADALPPLPATTLDEAVQSGDAAKIDAAAEDLALTLARQHLLGSSPQAERRGWGITDSADQVLDLRASLSEALKSNNLDGYFKSLLPRHPDYAALKAAYAAETVPSRKARIALNLDRWRWMPLELGPRYVFVNVPAFEAQLIETGKPARVWPVVVGKLSTPTPVLSAQVSGVIYNPWWEVPESIIRESVGALMRGSPAVAAARGYVMDQGRIRQKPGPGNALGQMKLAMPNPLAIYLHDTPSKRHFALPVRAYSHGCIRVGNALDFAATLLEGSIPRAKADAIVKSGQTQMVALKAPIPVYIAYFTVTRDASGKLRFLNDLYGRDAQQMSGTEAPQKNCGA